MAPPPRRPASSSTSTRPAPEDKEDGKSTETVEAAIRGRDGKVLVRRYIKGKLLGRGGFAKCYWATCVETSKIYAMKVVSKDSLMKSRARHKQLQTEINIHRELDHHHIVRFEQFFEDKKNAYILLELCHNRSMSELLKLRKRISEGEVQYYMLQLVQAIRHLHKRGVIHRDLKLGNLFLDRHMHIKVGDLGLAAKVSSAAERKRTLCGTPNYIAPEILEGTTGHSFQVDIWSLGVIVYTLLVGRPPYECKDVKSTYKRILANLYSFPEAVPVSDTAKSFIRCLLQTKPENRPSLDEIEAHPFLNLAWGQVPDSLPTSALYTIPDLLTLKKQITIAPSLSSPSSSSHSTTTTTTTSSTKASVKLATTGRRPLAPRDMNVEHVVNDLARLKLGDLDKKNKPPVLATAPPPVPSDHPSSTVQRPRVLHAAPRAAPPTGFKATKLAESAGELEKCRPKSKPDVVHSHHQPVIVIPPNPPLRSTTTATTSSTIKGLRSPTELTRVAGVHALVAKAPKSPRVTLTSTTRDLTRTGYTSSTISSACRSTRPLAPSSPATRSPCLAKQHGGSSTTSFTPSPAVSTSRPPSTSISPSSKASSSSPRSTGTGSRQRPTSSPAKAKTASVNRAPNLARSTEEPRGKQSPCRSTRSKGRAAPVFRTPEPPPRAQSGAPRELGTLEALHANLAYGLGSSNTSKTHNRDPHEQVDVRGGRARSTVSLEAEQPKVWVSRYVDYTAKYGLGYLLNTGSAGVFFNDSTKIIADPMGENVKYMDRGSRQAASSPLDHKGQGGTKEVCFKLPDYPEDLKKKVTLLGYFRDHLLAVEKRTPSGCQSGDDATSWDCEDDCSNKRGPVYVKKWIKTKYALLFRLSCRTVQVIFYDDTEVLLSAEARVVTYVDKQGQRSSYRLAGIMQDSSKADIAKRLRYVKDVLQQLLHGGPKPSGETDTQAP